MLFVCRGKAWFGDGILLLSWGLIDWVGLDWTCLVESGVALSLSLSHPPLFSLLLMESVSVPCHLALVSPFVCFCRISGDQPAYCYQLSGWLEGLVERQAFRVGRVHGCPLVLFTAFTSCPYHHCSISLSLSINPSSFDTE